MTWADPHGPWSKAINRRMTLIIAANVTSVLCIAGIAIWVLNSILPKLPRHSSTPTVFVVLMGVTMLVPVVFVMWWSRREQRIKRLVRQTDGLLCPWCKRSMHLVSSAPIVGCTRCKCELNGDEVREYWVNYALNPRAAIEWSWRHKPGSRSMAKVRQFMLTIRNKPAAGVAWMIAIWLIVGAAGGLLWRGGAISGIVHFLPMMTFMIGVVLIGHGWKRRVGTTRHCITCDYQVAPGDHFPSRCPECGTSWHDGITLVSGAPRWRPGLLVAGAALILLGLASLAAPLIDRNFNARLLPTSALIAKVTSPRRGFDMAEWNMLRSRALTREQTLSLATGLLDTRRNADEMLSPDADTWLAGQIAQQQLPDELVSRYYRESFDIEIAAPLQAHIGRPVEIKMGAAFRHTPFTAAQPCVYFSGYFVGDDPQPVGRHDHAISGMYFGDVRLGSKLHWQAPRANTTVHVVPSSPGPLPIKVRAWVVFVPMPGTNDPITWNGDWTPVIPPDAKWVEPVELLHSINVVE
jgi:hypothetical protein